MEINNRRTWNLKAFIIATLRRASYRYPPREEARRKAKVDRNQYKCNKCNNIFKRKDTKIDHIIPVIGEYGFTTWDEFITRLFCDVNNFQILCVLCHKDKTREENLQRKNNRYVRKKVAKKRK